MKTAPLIAAPGWTIMGVALVAAAVLAWFVAGEQLGLKTSAAERGTREGIAKLFRDPDSVQFRDTFVSSRGYWCGELNAKNGFGAYGGFQRFYGNHFEGKGFVVTAETEAATAEILRKSPDQARTEFEAEWEQSCRR